jgi:hypothetical protein
MLGSFVVRGLDRLRLLASFSVSLRFGFGSKQQLAGRPQGKEKKRRGPVFGLCLAFGEARPTRTPSTSTSTAARCQQGAGTPLPCPGTKQDLPTNLAHTTH